MPSRSRMSRMRSRIPAWIVTSSAVVGSSAISTFGLHATAMAIITRWRMPPESWCGYSSMRRAGAGMPTSSSSSIVAVARRRAVEPEVVAQHLADLAADGEDRVQRRHRLLEHEGDRRARARSRRLASSVVSRSRPLEAHGARRAAPRAAAGAAATSPSRSCRSPTRRPSRAPRPPSSENETRSTACTAPSSLSKRTDRSSTSSSAISASSSGRGRRAGRRRAG